jgi:hypothetical protein
MWDWPAAGMQARLGVAGSMQLRPHCKAGDQHRPPPQSTHHQPKEDTMTQIAAFIIIATPFYVWLRDLLASLGG